MKQELTITMTKTEVMALIINHLRQSHPDEKVRHVNFDFGFNQDDNEDLAAATVYLEPKKIL